ncbi:MAG: hypothetical protein COY19_02365, partial [Candidatus Marinimicrobia bacterium CG_4_10_14_0_2_um_filter_48_9]
LTNLDAEILERMHFRDIFRQVRIALEKNLPLDRKQMVEALSDSPWQSLITRILFDLDTEKAITIKLAQDCVRTLHHFQLHEELKVLRQRLREVEKSGGDFRAIIQQKQALELRLKTAQPD